MPTISVIVPVYKVEKYMHRCVDSILGQTYADFELILVDDGSPDNCGAICDEYAAKDSRVVVIHQENGGLSAARNAGIDWAFANSDSQWLSFIDSDDWVSINYLEYLLKAAQSNNIKISMCWLYNTTGCVPQNEPQYKVQLLPPEEAYVYQKEEVHAYSCGRLFEKELFRNIRFPEGKLFEDSFIIHEVIFACSRIAVLENSLYYYFNNPNGIVNSNWSLQKLDAYRAMETQIKFFSEQGFKQICQIQIRRYMSGVHDRIKEFSTNKEFYPLLKEVKRMRYRNFRSYAKLLDINDDTDAWVLTKVFPKRMWIYWHIKAILRKLGLQ